MRRGSSKTVLYFILDWGLGHATRSIPVIRGLLGKNHKVVIVSTGRSLALLRREFRGCECVALPDYGIRYSRRRWFLIPHLLARMPRIFLRLIAEHRGAEKLAVRFKADIIVSDNRYGCYSGSLPSYLMTHQLRFQLPRMLTPFAWISEWFNRCHFRHYRNVFVPDEGGTSNLSGDLSHRGRISKHPKVRYVGPLSSLDPGGPSRGISRGEAIDILFLISGPEPQRTKFEDLIMSQAAALPGRKVIVLGKPEEGADLKPRDEDGIAVYPHLERRMLSGFLKRARWVVSRSGYSTIMELTAVHRRAILIPTPGQTEQEYLAGYLHRAGMFFSAGQDHLDLRTVLEEAGRFYGRAVPRLNFNRIDLILSLLNARHPPVPSNDGRNRPPWEGGQIELCRNRHER